MINSIFILIAKASLGSNILKKYIFVFALVSISLMALANPPLASKQQIGLFLNSTTYVVLESNSLSYNAYIKEAVQKFWKITQFEFIDKLQFEKLRFDSKYSFLVILKGIYDNDPGGISYNYLSLVLGGTASLVTDMPEICSIPISYNDDNSLGYGYAIPSIVNFMQIHAKVLQKKRLVILVQGLNYYNNSKEFNDKVLLLNKETMAPDANSIQKIQSIYPYYVKLISTSEIEAELVSNPKNTLLNFHVGPTENSGAGKCFEMIFDVEGRLYYYNYRMITNENKDGFNLQDFKRIR
jgi:hypothetical protein